MKSRRVQLIPRPQKMANNLQRQGRSARLVERRSYCTEKLLAGWLAVRRLVCSELLEAGWFGSPGLM